MRFKTRLPVVSLCRRGYVDCCPFSQVISHPPTLRHLPLLSSLAPVVSSGQSPSLGDQRAPCFLRTSKGGGEVARKAISHGSITGGTEWPGDASSCRLWKPLLWQSPTWEKPQHSNAESFITLCIKQNACSLLRASLTLPTIPVSFCKLSAGKHVGNCLLVRVLLSLPLRLNLIELTPGSKKQVEEVPPFPPPFIFLSHQAHIQCHSLWELPGFIWTEWIFLLSWIPGDVTFELVPLLITLNMMMLIKII